MWQVDNETGLDQFAYDERVCQDDIEHAVWTENFPKRDGKVALLLNQGTNEKPRVRGIAGGSGLESHRGWGSLRKRITPVQENGNSPEDGLEECLHGEEKFAL